MLRCYNRGCGQEYDPEKNNEESCCHHPGAPYFHDAYKGWSCCNKKSVDFTEFLSKKGCTLSKHSNVKPPEPEKPKPKQEEEKVEIMESLPRPPVETAMTTIQGTIAPALKDLIDNMVTNSPSQTETNGTNEVTVGTSCKNSGCTYSYTGTSADAGECQHHSGVPIFHEGMKYWSCCQRKTSDFAVFMAQKGCVYGQHKWFKDNDDKRIVQCRYDWHQTATNVIVSIYAKKYHYAKSLLEVNPIRLHALLIFPEQENAKFELDMELRGIIDVTKTTAHMYGTKVEITMPKAEPGSWAKLDFPREKLPPPVKVGQQIPEKPQTVEADGDSDDDFNLDDIESVAQGVTLTEMASKKPDLD
ncbi:cysteine and histidine-rich domain-containing protein morgana [Stomoxys calcitrans]|uniref:cysteine and histidine-rich domain-containing protein morgana n=1 Tax=Stomoxys calcitrans TaxID=35570 RepID=UPI0027E2FFDE|nr:cysteine and histidine-rich domain-containing protein morgana [Stomoxys calcitrans]